MRIWSDVFSVKYLRKSHHVLCWRPINSRRTQLSNSIQDKVRRNLLNWLHLPPTVIEHPYLYMWLNVPLSLHCTLGHLQELSNSMQKDQRYRLFYSFTMPRHRTQFSWRFGCAMLVAAIVTSCRPQRSGKLKLPTRPMLTQVTSLEASGHLWHTFFFCFLFFYQF